MVRRYVRTVDELVGTVLEQEVQSSSFSRDGYRVGGTEPVTLPTLLIGTGLAAFTGAVSGAFLMWQVGYALDSPNIRRLARRGAVFGAAQGAIIGAIATLVSVSVPVEN